MIKIRCGVFETNSSSVHSLVMCSDDDYQKFIDNELLYDNWHGKFVTRKAALDKLYKEVKDSNAFKFAFDLSDNFSRKKLDTIPLDELEHYLMDECSIYTSNYYFTEQEFETYDEVYTAKDGEIIHAFGYYGHD